MRPDETAVRVQLERILASPLFTGSKRLTAFLRFTVERALAGRVDEIKEYQVGAEVYQRGPHFDPKVDNIVRVEANRLRAKLRDYYENGGREDPIRIEIPKGAYAPVFTAARRDRAPKSSSMLRIAAIVIAALMLAAAGGYWYARAPGRARRSIAVFGLKEITVNGDESRWISTALSEMLTMDLAEGEEVRTIPVDSVEQVKRDLGVGPADGLNQEVLKRIRTRTGADLVIAGAYTAFPDPGAVGVRIDLRVQDTRSGDTVATVSETGEAADLVGLAGRADSELRARLGMHARCGSESAALAPNPGAMRLYSEGLDQLRQMSFAAARDLFQRSIHADASNPLAYAALADALYALGYEVQARDTAQKAFGLASRLSRSEQLEIEARYRMYAGQWPEATRNYSSLWRAAPDSIDDALMLVECQKSGSHAQEALATIEKIRRTRGLPDDPRVDFAQARVLGSFGNYRGALERVRIAERKAQDQSARLLYAQERLFESGAMQALALPGVTAVRAEARRLCEQAGDGACVLKAMRIDAIHVVNDSPLAAQPMFEQALAMARQMGAIREMGNLLEGLAAVDEALGDLAGAEKCLDETLRIGKQLGAPSPETELNMADVYTSQGRLAEAAALEDRVVQSARDSGGKETLGDALAGSATILRLQGKIRESVERSHEALALARQSASAMSIYSVLMVDGDDLVAGGEFETARARYQEARKFADQWPGTLASTESALGRMLVANQQPRQAEPHLRLAVGKLRALAMVDEELRARAALVRALLAQHKNAGAARLAREMTPDAARTQNPEVRLETQIAVAEVESATGTAAEAARTLAPAVSEASRLGYAGLEREALGVPRIQH